VYSDFYEIPLPALCFEKVEEIHESETTPKRNDAFLITSEEQKHQIQKNDARLQNKGMQIHLRKTTRKKHKRFQNNETQTEKERQ
jgi:hypothetical protein